MSDTVSFNPYFRGDSSGSLMFIMDQPKRQNVSILIFVEIVLEELGADDALKAQISFNPYFRGDSTGRGNTRIGMG